MKTMTAVEAKNSFGQLLEAALTPKRLGARQTTSIGPLAEEKKTSLMRVVS